MGSHPLFIGRRNPQNSSRSGPELVLTRLSVDCPVDRSKCTVDRAVDRTKSPNIKGLTGNVGRLSDQPTQVGCFSLCNIGRSGNRSIQCLRMSVVRPVDQSPFIELKNSISYFFSLSTKGWLQVNLK